MTGIAEVLSAVAWPVVVLAIFLMLRSSITGLLARVKRLKAGAAGVDLLVERLQKEDPTVFAGRPELSGLTSHDVWALDSFASQTLVVTKLTPAQRVAARSLLDAGLLTIRSSGSDFVVQPTELGRRLLDAASSVSLKSGDALADGAQAQ